MTDEVMVGLQELKDKPAMAMKEVSVALSALSEYMLQEITQESELPIGEWWGKELRLFSKSSLIIQLIGYYRNGTTSTIGKPYYRRRNEKD